MTTPSVAADLRSALADRFRLTPAGQCASKVTNFPLLAADIALEVLRPVLAEKDEEIERLRAEITRYGGWPILAPKDGSEGGGRRG